MKKIETCVLVLAVALGFVPMAHAQIFSVLYDFGAKTGDPLNPGLPGLIAQGFDGNLYSTSANGGTQGLGTVFKITPGGKLTVLYNFDGPHGQAPLGGLTLGKDGNFYGTTWYGGAYGNGTIFKITPSGKPTVLYSFTGGSDGFQPYAPPIEGMDGNFYGTTGYGGALGTGTVYKITPSGNFTTLHAFSGSDGSLPIAPLVQGTDGRFYGTTQLGASNNLGEVFEITRSGTFTVLAQFDGADGGNPYAGVVQGSDGYFYGTASGWGSSGWGTIYKTNRTGIITDLYNFNGSSDGGGPYGGLVQATDGNFYGAGSGGGLNRGTIYSIAAIGTFSVIHNFDGTSGSDPTDTLFQHTSGLLYGDTTCGGTGATGGCVYGPGGGVFYSLDMGLRPFVSLVSSAGRVGSTIAILGQGFTGTTSVSFHGINAAFTVKASTYLTAIVPSGATTGFVRVTTPSGTLTSNKKFRVLP